MLALEGEALRIDEGDLSEQHATVAGGVRSKLGFQPVWMTEIVSGHQRDVCAAACRDRAIGGGPGALIVLIDADNPRIVERPDACGRRVGGAIVDDYELPIRERLSEHALDRIRD